MKRATGGVLLVLSSGFLLPSVGTIWTDRQAHSDSLRSWPELLQSEGIPMKRDDAMDLAKRGFDELSQALANGKSDTLTKYLEVMARFHNYSFRNTLMILMQRPNATRVAGFRQWEELGRSVKKGEKGIGIFAPMVYKKKQASDAESDDQVGDEQPGKTLRGFRVVHVFDVEQTDGQPLPEFACVEGEPGDWLRKLEAVVCQAGIGLEYVEHLGGADGLSEGGKISVLAELPAAEKFCVLAHEYGHELLHKGERRNETNKKVRETEAEAVAYVVARAIGLDVGTHASDYIQLYRGDTETLQESMHVIQQATTTIIESLNRADLAEQLDVVANAVAARDPTVNSVDDATASKVRDEGTAEAPRQAATQVMLF